MERDKDFFSFMSMPKELVTFNRPIRLKLDLPGGINDDMLLPQRVFGTETLCGGIDSVSYTHLTLPTSDLV